MWGIFRIYHCQDSMFDWMLSLVSDSHLWVEGESENVKVRTGFRQDGQFRLDI